MRQRSETFPVALPAALIAAVITGFAVLSWPALTRVPFYTKGEPREALVVQSLAGGDNVILPTRNGNELPSKPLLFHWLGAAISILDGGVTEATVRMPSLIASVVTLVATAAAAWAWAGPSTAAASTVVLATSLQWLASSVTARVDLLLAACIALALFAFARAYHAGRPIPLATYALMVAATLTKGPVGLVLPSMVVLAFLWARRDLAYLRAADARRLAAACAAASIWYVAAFVVGGEAFVAKQILKENVLRVLDPDSVDAGHVRPFWYYVPLLAAGAAPWTLFAPALAVSWRRRRSELLEGPMLLPLVWLAVTVGLFSLAGSKRSVYLLPAYPAIALLVGRAWATLDEDCTEPSRAREVSMTIGAAAIGVLATVAAMAVAAHLAGAQVAPMLAPLMSETDNANVPAALASIDAHQGLAALWAALVVAATAGMGFALRGGRCRAVMGCAAAIVMATAVFASTTLLPALAERRSSRGFLSRAEAVLPADAPLSFFGGIDYGAVFYRGRPIPTLERLADLSPIDGAWLLTRRASLPALATQAQEWKTGHEASGTYDVAEVLADQPSQSSLLLVRIVRRPRDERSSGNREARP
ncbi:MAG TPA: glycosyltransferase family 39 protein [Candidatus Limnocylindrales bacterium]|nr:glycosyltransferase family 39 protein [Candidatus Limnocylindrales bacterium]